MLRWFVVASVAPASSNVPDERYGHDQKDDEDDYCDDDRNHTTLTKRRWVVILTRSRLSARRICAKLKPIHDDDDDCGSGYYDDTVQNTQKH